MERRYKFKIKLQGSDILPILKIKTVNRAYPVDFVELNIPLIVGCKNGETCYCLDYRRSFDINGDDYHKSYLKRNKQREVLSILEEKIDSKILNALDGGQDFSGTGEVIKFDVNGGFDYCKRVSGLKKCKYRSGGKLACTLNQL